MYLQREVRTYLRLGVGGDRSIRVEEIKCLAGKEFLLDLAEGVAGFEFAAEFFDGDAGLGGHEREAVLEFPPGPKPRFGEPPLKASQIEPELVARAIASAITAGWEPLSRGKTVAIVVDAEGG